jgi:hypothetical protein
MDPGQACGSAEHEDDEGHEVQACQGLGQAFVVARQPVTPSRPGKSALDDPPAKTTSSTSAAITFPPPVSSRRDPSLPDVGRSHRRCRSA